MLISFCISFFLIKVLAQIRWLFILLFFSILTESIVEALKHSGREYYFLYYYFTPIEFLCISFYFLNSYQNKWYKTYILGAIFIFTALCTWSLAGSHLKEFPDLLTNIESFFIITFCIIGLLLIEPEFETNIYSIPIFWINMSFLVYSSGIFIPLIFQMYAKGANHLFQLISKICNCILYLLLIIGFLLLWKKRK